MNLIEALKALEEGKKIRRKTWVGVKYVRLDKDGKLVNDLGQEASFLLSSDDIKTSCWKVAEEPALTEEEKECLRAMVRLFGRRMDHIREIREYTLEELGL